MKFTFLKNIKNALFVASGLLIVNVSCSKVDIAKEDAEGDPTDVVTNPDLFANFNWSSSKTADVHVSVDDEFNGQYFYKLELFDKEPHDADAKSLGAGLAKKGQDLNTQVVIPTGLSTIFVQKTSPIGEVSYSILDATGSKINASSKTASSAKVASLNVKGLTKVASTSGDYSSAPVAPAVPSDAQAIKGSAAVTTVPASKSYVIKAGETFAGDITTLENTDGIVVYVQGKWHHGRPIALGRNTKIVVLPQGELNVSAINLNSGTASFQNYGDVLLNSLTINANNAFSNIGTLKIIAAVSMVGKAEFINFQKDVKVKIGSLTMRDADCVATNNGEIEILNGTFNNGTLNANCYTTVGTMQASKSTINIRPLAMLDVTNLRAEGAVFNLDIKGVLDVTKEANFKADADGRAVIINSIATDPLQKPFVRIKYVTVGTANTIHLTYNGNMIVVTDNHPRRADNKFTTGTNNTNVEIFWDRYNHPPYVAATSCNNGGAGTIPSTPPANQTLQAIDLGTFTYLFEDNWPVVGDYDLNDFVLSVNVVKYQNQANQVEKVVLKNKVYAIGATRRLGAAIQLDNVLASAVKSVTYSNTDVVGVNFPLVSGVGIEQGQSKAVVTVMDDAHKAFGLSTPALVFTHAGYSPFESEITITFNSPISGLSIHDLNPFIVSAKGGAPGKRHEVHLVGYKATDKIDPKIVEDAQKAEGTLSATDPFKTKDGWPFAIAVPVAQFKYQRVEGKHIKEAYPQFMNWVTSGGTSNQDWYNFPNN